MNNNVIFSLLLVHAWCVGMEQLVTPPSSPLVSPRKGVAPSKWRSGIRFTGQETPILKEIVSHLNQVPSGGYIGVDDKYVSDNEVVKALVSAKQRGVIVVVNIGEHAKPDVIARLQNASIEIHKIRGQHIKRYITAERAPVGDDLTREQLGSVRVYSGSHNTSYVAPHHKDIMGMVVDDTDYFEQHLANHRAISAQRVPLKDVAKQQLGGTPVKRTITSSQEFDVNRAKRERIEKLARSTDITDCADITSMTFDSDDIVNAVELVMQARAHNPPPIRLIFDGSALNAKNKPLLDRMRTAGAKIYIYNRERSKKVFNRFPQLQHAKTILRQCAGECLSVISSGNLTRNSAREFNIDSYHACDPKLFKDIKQFNDALVAESEEYTGQ